MDDDYYTNTRVQQIPLIHGTSPRTGKHPPGTCSWGGDGGAGNTFVAARTRQIVKVV